MPYFERSERGKHTARLHAQRAERRLADLREEVEKAERMYNGGGEAEVVIGVTLAKVLVEWEEKWTAQRAAETENTTTNGGMRVMSAKDWLKEMTGIHARRIYGLMKAEFKFVSLAQADLLLTVIGSTALQDGTLRVIPNPNWSPEKWLAYMEERGCL
jgi:hypothetical protein